MGTAMKCCCSFTVTGSLSVRAGCEPLETCLGRIPTKKPSRKGWSSLVSWVNPYLLDAI